MIEIDVNEVERLAGLGLTYEEIALSLGISETTLYSRKRDSAVFEAAIKRGKANAGKTVASELFEQCKQGNLTAIIWYEKTRRGLSDKTAIEHSGRIDVSKLSDDELNRIADA